MGSNDIVLVGTGSLARAICSAVATTCGCTVTVLSTDVRRAEEVCFVAGVRAALAGSGAEFRPLRVPYTSDDFSVVLRRIQPAVVLNTASRQSPWEGTRSPSGWTALTKRAGFGSTLPLQAVIAVELARAVAADGSGARYINACFPDAVNPVLRALDLPIFCGIGNVALLSATLQESLRLSDQRPLQVLGHHWHLYQPNDERDEALAWLDGTRVTDVRARLAAQRRTARAELNGVNGYSVALLLRGLLRGEEILANLPGPNGLPGGYPVRVRGDAISLNLPDGVSEKDAVERNQYWSERDGVRVSDDGALRFTVSEPELEPLAGVRSVAELPELYAWMRDLRSRLREETLSRS